MENIDQRKSNLWNTWQARLATMPEYLARPIEGTPVVTDFNEIHAKDLWIAFFPDLLRSHTSKLARKRKHPEFECKTWLDSQGRPIRVLEQGPQFDCQAFLDYSDTSVEMVQFNTRASTVSSYGIATSNSHDHLMLNCRGDLRFLTPDLDPAARAARIQSCPSNYLLVLEDGSDGYCEGLGLKPTRYSITRTFDATGQLQRIDQHWDTGNQTIYAAKSGRKAKDLVATLAERIAELTLEALQEDQQAAPLRALELSFRFADNYLPYVIPCTADDFMPDFGLPCHIPGNRWINLPEERCQPELAELLAEMQSSENWNQGALMLRRAARILNDRVPTTLRVAKDFIAYAMDWEIEGHEAAKIFTECGASAAQIKRWQNGGLL